MQEKKRKVGLVLLPVVGEDEVFELHFNLHPLFIRQRRPDVVRLRDSRLVWFENELRAVVVDVKRSQDENETGERLKQTMKRVLYYTRI